MIDKAHLKIIEDKHNNFLMKLLEKYLDNVVYLNTAYEKKIINKPTYDIINKNDIIICNLNLYDDCYYSYYVFLILTNNI